MVFQELETSKKIEHLLLILEDLKGFDESVDRLIISLTKGNIDDPTELDNIYNLVMGTIKESNEEFDNKRLDDFEKNKNLVSYISDKETQERLGEQNIIDSDILFS